MKYQPLTDSYRILQVTRHSPYTFRNYSIIQDIEFHNKKRKQKHSSIILTDKPGMQFCRLQETRLRYIDLLVFKVR